ncbi:MAG: zinc-binding dehydrogenase [Planctomycetaceae bacterium]|nr:zinc-binding dehydrogenase [Planctomycetaceae bacterium]
MRALTIEKQGSPVLPNVRLFADFPEPTAGAGEVVVRTEAAALNHLDLWVGRGLPGIDIRYPAISGSDGAGVVESVGAGVDPSWIGRRVLLNAAVPKPDKLVPGMRPTPCDIHMIGEHGPGCLAEKFTAPVANVLDLGDSDPVEAAAFGLTHLTAWRMMVTQARLEAGMVVLITGIGGGVALAALAIARHFGCETIVTSRHSWKLERAKALGATHGVLDAGSDWSREVRQLTGRRGVDLCVDSVGKAVHGSCIKSLARGGTFATCGATTGPDATTDLTRIFWNQLRLVGSTMGDMHEFRQVVSLFKSGAIRPQIDRVFAPSEGVQAFERLEAGEQFGKLVVDWRRA